MVLNAVTYAIGGNVQHMMSIAVTCTIAENVQFMALNAVTYVIGGNVQHMMLIAVSCIIPGHLQYNYNVKCCYMNYCSKYTIYDIKRCYMFHCRQCTF